jgi:hypothetical protein
MLATVPSAIEHETRLEEIPTASGHDAAPDSTIDWAMVQACAAGANIKSYRTDSRKSAEELHPRRW